MSTARGISTLILQKTLAFCSHLMERKLHRMAGRIINARALGVAEAALQTKLNFSKDFVKFKLLRNLVETDLHSDKFV